MKNLNEQIERINQLSNYEVGVVINEQSSGSLVPQKIVKAISAIENKYSYMDNGKITGQYFSGNEKISKMSDYVRETIGFDCWSKMSDKLKSQIYSFCFQSDSKKPFKMKFIAGLANAIEPSINRGKIVGKDVNDPDVKAAIKLIKNNCDNINDYYNSYLTILDQQYKSMDFDDNYKYIWKYRPIAIDRILSGEDINKVLKDWGKSFGTLSDTSTEGVDESNEKIEKIEHNNDPNLLRERLKKLGVIINPSVKYVGTNNGYVEVKYLTNCPNEGECNKRNLSYVFSDSGEEDTVLEKVKIKNTIVDEIDYSMKGVKGYIITIQQ